MKLSNLHEDEYRPVEPDGLPSWQSMQYKRPSKIEAQGVLYTAKTAAKDVVDRLKDAKMHGAFIDVEDAKHLQRQIRIVKSNPKIADGLYRWMADFMRKVGHSFDIEDMEHFRDLLVYLRK